MPCIVNCVNAAWIDRVLDGEEASLEEGVMRESRRSVAGADDQRVPRPRNPDGEKSDGLR